jgi:hypothetical protein
MSEMEYVFGGLALLTLVATVFGARTGRIRVSSCCSDPEHDLRMRAAFEPDDSTTSKRATNGDSRR